MNIAAEPRSPYSDVHDNGGYTSRRTTMAEIALGLVGPTEANRASATDDQDP